MQSVWKTMNDVKSSHASDVDKLKELINATDIKLNHEKERTSNLTKTVSIQYNIKTLTLCSRYS